MGVAEKTRLITQEYPRLPHQGYGLVVGEMRPKHGESRGERMSAFSSWVGTRFVIRLGTHVEAHQLGRVYAPDNGFRCLPASP